jgi:hypothetical protein
LDIAESDHFKSVPARNWDRDHENLVHLGI